MKKVILYTYFIQKNGYFNVDKDLHILLKTRSQFVDLPKKIFGFIRSFTPRYFKLFSIGGGLA